MEHLVEFEKYFDPREVLLAGELWDRLSGEPNTMENILNIINQIAKPDFLEKFEFINNPENFEKDKEKYMKILKEWFLFDEIKIFENYENLKEKNYKLLHQQLFKNDGRYNIKRRKLLELI